MAADILVSPITPEILSAREFKDGTMELLERLEPGSALGATLGPVKAVTRRQGESHYIVEAGGYTRLLALQPLWAETRNLRYCQLVVLFRPSRSESHVLSAHLIENEQRGEMCFWDKATGIITLKERLEAEHGRQLTLRALEDALHAVGLAVNTATPGLYLFASERLRTLGEAVVGLTGLDVKTLQPRLNAIKRYAQAHRSSSEDELYATVFEPIFRRIADKYPHHGEFSVAATCGTCEAAMAEHLGETVDALREGLRATSARGGQGEALATRPEQGTSPPAQRRAWWLLAGIKQHKQSFNFHVLTREPSNEANCLHSRFKT